MRQIYEKITVLSASYKETRKKARAYVRDSDRIFVGLRVHSHV